MTYFCPSIDFPCCCCCCCCTAVWRQSLSGAEHTNRAIESKLQHNGREQSRAEQSRAEQSRAEESQSLALRLRLSSYRFALFALLCFALHESYLLTKTLFSPLTSSWCIFFFALLKPSVTWLIRILTVRILDMKLTDHEIGWAKAQSLKEGTE